MRKVRLRMRKVRLRIGKVRLRMRLKVVTRSKLDFD